MIAVPAACYRPKYSPQAPLIKRADSKKHKWPEKKA
jgi:hypothetical protein